MIWRAVSKGPESAVVLLFQGGILVFLEVWCLPLKKTLIVLKFLEKRFFKRLSYKRKPLITGFLAHQVFCFL